MAIHGRGNGRQHTSFLRRHPTLPRTLLLVLMAGALLYLTVHHLLVH